MDAEILVKASWVLPIDDKNSELADHAVALADGRILAVLPNSEAERSIQARQIIDLPDHVLMPGLVNAHTHVAMNLLRGYADDLPLMDWLQNHIWPAEARWVDPNFVADGTRLAILEMLRGGTTCFHDMYFYPEITARVSNEIGMRAQVGLIVIECPSSYAETPDDYLQKGLVLHDEYAHHPLIATSFAPHSPYTVSDATLQRIRTIASELEAPIHIHLHETRDEIEQSIANQGSRPIARLQNLGLLGAQLIAVHMTQLTQDEIALLAATGTHVVHCPESNLKLASGFCPVADLLDAGVNVALGTDGAASNNDLDMFGEMRTAALLAKGVAGNAAAVPAHTALRMATINGAKALGLEQDIGSLEVGKAADMIAVNLKDLNSRPFYNLASQLVYATARSQVSHVWINGRPLLQAGQPITLDMQELETTCTKWQQRLTEFPQN